MSAPSDLAAGGAKLAGRPTAAKHGRPPVGERTDSGRLMWRVTHGGGTLALPATLPAGKGSENDRRPLRILEGEGGPMKSNVAPKARDGVPPARVEARSWS